jgi:hypothetical protein
MRLRESYIIHLKELRPGVDLGMRLDEDNIIPEHQTNV